MKSKNQKLKIDKNLKKNRRLKSAGPKKSASSKKPGIAKFISRSHLKLIKEITAELLNLMGMEEVKIKLSQKKGEAVKIDIDCLNSGLLIGSRGETISSLQLILSLMACKKLGSWQRIIVNVGDYLEKRTESLEKMALNVAQRVKFSGKEAVVSYLNSAERRIVHLTLADHPDVMTESAGEGRERRLVVKPVNSK